MAELSSLPAVVFVSCTDEHPNHMIHQMFDSLPEPRQVEANVESYVWSIDNKYYTAEIRLCSLTSKSLPSGEFSESVRGVVIYFDSEMPNALGSVESWYSTLKHMDPEIKILACSECKESSEKGCDKLKVQEWCIRQGFELVELSPFVEDDSDCEDDFAETKGIQRIGQALQAYTWENLVAKEKKELTSMIDLWNGGHCKSTGTDFDSMVPRTEDNIEPSSAELVEDPNSDFSDLFGQLSMMKEQATKLSSSERKKFAEQVVLAYWRAFDGDEDELLDT